MTDIITLQLGLPGGPELLIVLVVIVLLFGANRIPKLARSTGQAMGEFKRGREQIEEEITDAATGEVGDSEDSETELESEFDEDLEGTDGTEATEETEKSS
jgi:sec-independent protein translocase protein TatA